MVELILAKYVRFARYLRAEGLETGPGFAPEAHGMRAALPFVDDFIGVSSLDDLQALVQLLESVGAAPRSGADREVLAS